MSGSNLFHLLMIGVKGFLKYSDLQEALLNKLTRRQEPLTDCSKAEL